MCIDNISWYFRKAGYQSQAIVLAYQESILGGWSCEVIPGRPSFRYRIYGFPSHLEKNKKFHGDEEKHLSLCHFKCFDTYYLSWTKVKTEKHVDLSIARSNSKFLIKQSHKYPHAECKCLIK
jgi:hypothetical protein